MTVDLGLAVVECLARADIPAEVGFHGNVVVDIVPGKEQLVTGYASWAYGQVYVLNEAENSWDDCRCPDENHHYTSAWCDEDCEDPVVIAQGITRFVQQHHQPCRHCTKPIKESTIDPAYPHLHVASGNAFCDVDVPEDAVMFAGTAGRTMAEPA